MKRLLSCILGMLIISGIVVNIYASTLSSFNGTADALRSYHLCDDGKTLKVYDTHAIHDVPRVEPKLVETFSLPTRDNEENYNFKLSADGNFLFYFTYNGEEKASYLNYVNLIDGEMDSNSFAVGPAKEDYFMCVYHDKNPDSDISYKIYIASNKTSQEGGGIFEASYDKKTHKLFSFKRIYDNEVLKVAIAPDGKNLYALGLALAGTGVYSPAIIEAPLDGEAPKPILFIPCKIDGSSLVISSDGKTLCVATSDHTMIVVDTTTDTPSFDIAYPTAVPESAIMTDKDTLYIGAYSAWNNMPLLLRYKCLESGARLDKTIEIPAENGKVIGLKANPTVDNGLCVKVKEDSGNDVCFYVDTKTWEIIPPPETPGDLDLILFDPTGSRTIKNGVDFSLPIRKESGSICCSEVNGAGFSYDEQEHHWMLDNLRGKAKGTVLRFNYHVDGDGRHDVYYRLKGKNDYTLADVHVNGRKLDDPYLSNNWTVKHIDKTYFHTGDNMIEIEVYNLGHKIWLDNLHEDLTS